MNINNRSELSFDPTMTLLSASIYKIKGPLDYEAKC